MLLTSEQAQGLTEALETVRESLEPGEGVILREDHGASVRVEPTIVPGGVRVDAKGKTEPF